MRGGKKDFKKRYGETPAQITEGFSIAVDDELIFVHDVLVRRKLWLPIGIRPIIASTGSHQRTCVLAHTMKCKQPFLQYGVFNQRSFLDYLKQVRKGLGKVIMFMDGARHHRSKKVLEYLEDKDAIRMAYLLKGSPSSKQLRNAAGDRGSMIYGYQNTIPDLLTYNQQSPDTTGQDDLTWMW